MRLGLGRIRLASVAVVAAQALWHFVLIRDRRRDGCFKAFRLNYWLGFAMFAGTALEPALRDAAMKPIGSPRRT